MVAFRVPSSSLLTRENHDCDSCKWPIASVDPVPLHVGSYG